MSLGAVLVVLIVSTADSDPAAPALAAAAQELLGSSALIRVDLTREDLSDNETLALAGVADGVVELVWTEDHSSALLHCYVTRDERWVDRRITFSPNDREPERGRLLGFAMASMFPRLVAAPEPPPAPASAAPPTQPAPQPARQGNPSRALPTRLQVELLGSATTGIRGPADAVGATLGIRLPLVPRLALHAAVGGRIGDIPLAQATTKVASGALGLASLASPFDSSLELGVRADFLATWLEVTRAVARDAEVESRSRSMFGGAILVEGGYRLSRALGVYSGAGMEVLFGETDIYAEGQLEAKLPLFRIVGEFGFRARF